MLSVNDFPGCSSRDKGLKTAYKRFYVDIGSVVGQSDKIWTISLNEESPKTPLVLLHGMGAGLALWCPNLDSFAATRPVYAIDLLGFGRSSRPKFASDAQKAEAQWVESVEEWRREVNLGQFILLGHSLGGVRHLVLADPWGFAERPPNAYEKAQLPLWVRVIGSALQPLNPLWAVRAAGPAGKCGESAFHTLMTGFGWAKNPMVRRVNELDPALPITVLYGSRSWVDNSSGQVLVEQHEHDPRPALKAAPAEPGTETPALPPGGEAPSNTVAITNKASASSDTTAHTS
ncbi:hypothetical protein HF086_017752 [Spodoptera exigua]|uniref:AB hydrolase-1 domain-containing protein n=1 Tax=Spodoptera exigua TaxID=7107 RepID=A0A922SCQ6_SPOEX|nr:hypothetical protein HF086_017752 [Spodoptera exigua]